MAAGYYLISLNSQCNVNSRFHLSSDEAAIDSNEDSVAEFISLFSGVARQLVARQLDDNSSAVLDLPHRFATFAYDPTQNSLRHFNTSLQSHVIVASKALELHLLKDKVACLHTSTVSNSQNNYHNLNKKYFRLWPI